MDREFYTGPKLPPAVVGDVVSDFDDMHAEEKAENRLDRELRHEYRLRLISYDGGHPARSDTINVTKAIYTSSALEVKT